MTRQEILKKYPRASESCIVRNLGPVHPTGDGERKRSPRPALDKDAKAKSRSSISVAVIITLIRCGERLLDNDNAVGGNLKAMRDAIARTLDIDDGDPRLRWHYGQCQTTGTHGVLVKIERL